MNIWQKINKPAVGLSPMDGVTDYSFRQIQISIAKPDIMFTEFISAEGFIRQPKKFERNLFFKGNERPLIVQIFGYTPEAFYETILKISELDFDGIDINMGCPAKSVLEKGGGGALIENYQLSAEILEKSIKAIDKSGKKIPLSVKTRIGQKKIVTKSWVKFLSEYPLSEITIHGRLLKQGNNGPVNWEEVRKASDICHSKDIVCFGNGGIKSLSEAKELSNKYNLDGVLIGQAACGNPWFFKNKKPTKDQIIQTILDHAKLVSEFYEEKGFVTVLKHFSWYPKGFKNSKKLKIELLKTRSFSEVQRVIANFS